MIDSEYVKLNSSINTGTNSNQLRYNSEGNVEATIELQLPDNLYDNNSMTRKIERVDMQTAKLRLSLENTPIAQIPLDTVISTDSLKVSTCQLDVYPYCPLHSVKQIDPDPSNTAALSLPNYKRHIVQYKIYYYNSVDQEPILLEEQECQANTQGFGYPTGSRYYEMLHKSDVLNAENHLMNLCVSNHESFNIEEDQLFIKNIGTLEQMLEDALENAVTFACTNDKIVINVNLINTAVITDITTPAPDMNNIITLEDYGVDAAFWYWEKDPYNSTSASTMKHAFKPRVSIKEQSITISYDTAAFHHMVPIIWNTPFVYTYDQPEQMTLDVLRKNIWAEKPPKRIYKYGISLTSNPETYYFSLLNNSDCAVMNIIANDAMKDVFSFLPWIEVQTKDYPQLQNTALNYHYERTRKEKIQSTKSVSFDVAISHSTGGGTLIFYSMDDELNYDSSFWQTYLIGTDASDGTPYDASGSIIAYRFSIANSDIDISAGTWQLKYPWTKRQNPTVIPALAGSGIATFSVADFFPSEIQRSFAPVQYDLVSSERDLGVQESYDIYSGTPGTTERIIGDRMEQNVESYTSHQVPLFGFYGVTANPAIMDIVINAPSFPNSTPNNYINAPPPEWDTYLLLHKAVEILKDETTTTVCLFYRMPDISTTYHINVLNKDVCFMAFYNPFTSGQTVTKDMSFVSDDVITTIDEITITRNELQNDSNYKDMCPNLKVTDEKFYILDGTTAQVDIGPQEVVYDNEPVLDEEGETYKYKVADITEVTTQSEIVKKRKSCAEVQGVRDDYIFSPYLAKEEYGQVPVGSPCPYFDLPIWEGVPPYYVALDSGHSPVTSIEGVNRWFVVPESWSGTRYIGQATESIVERTTTPEEKTRSEDDSYSNDDLTPGETINPPTTETTSGITSEEITGTSEFYNGIQVYTMTPENIWAHLSSSTTMCPGVEVPAYNNDSRHMIPAIMHKEVSIPPYGRCYFYVWSLSSNTSNITRKTVINTDITETKTTTTTQTSQIIYDLRYSYKGNIRLSFTWDNLPIVVLSPITSIVLSLKGIQVAQEYQPINRTTVGGSSLTSSIPIIENFYSMAQSLRDLHDELVVAKDNFTTAANYQLAAYSGKERTIKMSAMYITKDGKLHQIYIPKHGVFSVQLIFGLSYYSTT